MNIVLDDAYESRENGKTKREMGTIVIRGSAVVMW